MSFEEVEDQTVTPVATRPSRNPNGRTPILRLTDEMLKEVHGLAGIQCTQREAAAVLGVHRDTFVKFLNTHEKAMAAWESGAESGKASLRRDQYRSAQNGNATMQIWLGKQWLDQKDKNETTLEGGSRPIILQVVTGVPRRPGIMTGEEQLPDETNARD